VAKPSGAGGLYSAPLNIAGNTSEECPPEGFLSFYNSILITLTSVIGAPKILPKDNHQFGWKTIQKVFAEDLKQAKNGFSQKVPDSKYVVCFKSGR